MPNLKCCVCGGYRKRHNHLTVFAFPVQEARQQQWLQACNLLEVGADSGVCEAHFAPSAFSNSAAQRKRLQAMAVPSLQLRGGVPATSVFRTSSPARRSEARRSATNRKLLVPTHTYMVLRRAMQKAGLLTVGNTILHLAERYLAGDGDGGRSGEGGGGAAGGGDGDAGDCADVAWHSRLRALLSPVTSRATKEPANVEGTRSALAPGGSQGPAWALGRGATLDAAMGHEQIDVEMGTGEEGDPSLGATAGEESHWGTRSAFVSEPQLRELAGAAAVLCIRCGARCGVNVTRVTVSFTITWECKACDTVTKKWMSTPKDGHTMVIDTLLSAAVVLSGSHLEELNKMLSFANIGQLSETAYSRTTHRVVAPVIEEAFNKTMAENREAAMAASPDGLVIAGDCQNDSPSSSASYGCCTIMDHTTGHIIAQNIVCSEEVGFASPKLEVEGLSRCLSDLQELPIKEFISDQHLGVRKAVRQHLPGAQYSCAVWHAAKSVAKRLRQHAAKPKNRALRPWKRWLMVLNHVVNIHATPSGLNRCHHADVPEDESRDRPWLRAGSPAHNALWEVVASLRTLNLAAFVVTCRHTDNLEMFHTDSLVYAPKLTYFEPSTFVARKRAAVLEWSSHLGRGYATDEEGNVKTSRVYSRVSDQYVVRPVKVPKTFPHVRPLLEAIVNRHMNVTVADPLEQ
ncbi:uncharacterized protein LOC119099943 isoform X2 [Pollicipes pollicipes]|uniref:uncharacterized protein LOC119099943 isoform X2 n=1 Tax=Pollicipes pollicipes TaxID=41117 RepID=UPI001884E76E|nr:uncharacterized protein LOC119099943 isoform X2 [Pollicipes pollicipes]